jgi:hypothetical protein
MFQNCFETLHPLSQSLFFSAQRKPSVTWFHSPRDSMSQIHLGVFQCISLLREAIPALFRHTLRRSVRRTQLKGRQSTMRHKRDRSRRLDI